MENKVKVEIDYVKTPVANVWLIFVALAVAIGSAAFIKMAPVTVRVKGLSVVIATGLLLIIMVGLEEASQGLREAYERLSDAASRLMASQDRLSNARSDWTIVVDNLSALVESFLAEGPTSVVQFSQFVASLGQFKGFESELAGIKESGHLWALSVMLFGMISMWIPRLKRQIAIWYLLIFLSILISYGVEKYASYRSGQDDILIDRLIALTNRRVISFSLADTPSKFALCCSRDAAVGR